MQRSLNGANNFGSILGTSLSKYANLADLPNTTLARQNLGLVGAISVNSANTYLTITNAFDGTANQTISANATTNATPSTLLAYDANGAITANSVGVYDVSRNVITAINCHATNAGSLKFLNVFSIKSPTFANLNVNNIYNFQQLYLGNGDTNYYGVLNVDYITTSAAGSIRIPANVSMENVGMGANGAATLSVDNITAVWNAYLSLNSPIHINGSITLNYANSSIIDANNQNAITFDGNANTTIQRSLTITNGNITFGTASSSINDANNGAAITFDGSQNLTIPKNMTISGTLYSSTFRNNGNVFLTNVTPYTTGANIVYKTGIKFFSANTSIVDSNNANAITFDGSANVAFYNNINVPNQATIGGIVIPSPATTLNFYSNSTTTTGARTDTSGNFFGANLYRTIWSQGVNTSFATTTALNVTSSLIIPNTQFTMTNSQSFRLFIPFTYRGETKITLNAWFSFSSVIPTRYIGLQIYSYNGSTFSGNVYQITNPSNNAWSTNSWTFLSTPPLTVGSVYVVGLYDNTFSGSCTYSISMGEISLGNI
jgi:hypothetical protein